MKKAVFILLTFAAITAMAANKVKTSYASSMQKESVRIAKIDAI